MMLSSCVVWVIHRLFERLHVVYLSTHPHCSTHHHGVVWRVRTCGAVWVVVCTHSVREPTIDEAAQANDEVLSLA